MSAHDDYLDPDIHLWPETCHECEKLQIKIDELEDKVDQLEGAIDSIKNYCYNGGTHVITIQRIIEQDLATLKQE